MQNFQIFLEKGYYQIIHDYELGDSLAAQELLDEFM